MVLEALPTILTQDEHGTHNQGNHRGDKHGSSGNVLGKLCHRIVIRTDEVDNGFDGRVEHFCDDHQGNREQEDQHLAKAQVHKKAEQDDDEDHVQVKAHVALGLKREDDAVQRDLEWFKDVSGTTHSSCA